MSTVYIAVFEHSDDSPSLYVYSSLGEALEHARREILARLDGAWFDDDETEELRKLCEEDASDDTALVRYAELCDANQGIYIEERTVQDRFPREEWCPPS